MPPQNVHATSRSKINTIYIIDSELVKENTSLTILKNTADIEDLCYLKEIMDNINLDYTSFSIYF